MSKIGIIDYYENENAWNNSKPKKGSMILFPNFRVVRCSQHNSFSKTNYDREYVLEVIAQKKILRIAAENRTIQDSWIQKIQRMATLKPSTEGNLYPIQTTDSKSMQQLGIAAINKCFLWLCTSGIILAEKDSQSIIAMWSYRCIRSFNCTGSNRFTFESGRRSLLGQGEYHFYTKGQDNVEINRLISCSITYKFKSADEGTRDSIQRKMTSVYEDYDKMDTFIEYSVGFNSLNLGGIASSEIATPTKSPAKDHTTSQPIATPKIAIDRGTASASGSFKFNEWANIKNMRLNNSACQSCSGKKKNSNISTCVNLYPNYQSRSLLDRNPVYGLDNNANQKQQLSHSYSGKRVSSDSNSGVLTVRYSQDMEETVKTKPNPSDSEYATFCKDSCSDMTYAVLEGAQIANAQEYTIMGTQIEPRHDVTDDYDSGSAANSEDFEQTAVSMSKYVDGNTWSNTADTMYDNLSEISTPKQQRISRDGENGIVEISPDKLESAKKIHSTTTISTQQDSYGNKNSHNVDTLSGQLENTSISHEASTRVRQELTVLRNDEYSFDAIYDSFDNADFTGEYEIPVSNNDTEAMYDNFNGNNFEDKSESPASNDDDDIEAMYDNFNGNNFEDEYVNISFKQL
ncbi:uncharacterized protein TRIADDRAFT_53177 [Trichoplax adhaerens]|uniref:PH domain-containing protein n=1 Tax=Trichoplax adhaerens TaxID=10228 RepID=B3RNI4_TRIAD|nr:hypothetical protein TRIADDRAFT_53177 [Trichoplax adhaerens]EDV28026.1 hypothetical protein TRIADDRAFT_53177 [Trichoplax adhaerens]|eukprot:XP_002109860.1 hypothetical protein TRIADDRAFT_53177 [Trichoplax adhaerens]